MLESSKYHFWLPLSKVSFGEEMYKQILAILDEKKTNRDQLIVVPVSPFNEVDGLSPEFIRGFCDTLKCSCAYFSENSVTLYVHIINDGFEKITINRNGSIVIGFNGTEEKALISELDLFSILGL